MYPLCQLCNRYSRGLKRLLLLQGMQKLWEKLTGLRWAVIETVGTSFGRPYDFDSPRWGYVVRLRHPKSRKS